MDKSERFAQVVNAFYERHKNSWLRYGSPQKLRDDLLGNPPLEFTYEEIEQHPLRRQIGAHLAYLGPQKVWDEFGDGCALATFRAVRHGRGIFEEYRSGLADQIGATEYFVESSLLTPWRRYTSSDANHSLHNARLGIDVLTGKPPISDLTPYFVNKKAARKSDQYEFVAVYPTTGSYRGQCIQVQREVTDFHYAPFMDSFVGYALMHQDIPIAISSMDASDSNSVVLVQMQGVQGVRLDEESNVIESKSTRSLNRINFKHLFYDAAKAHARRMGSRRIGIQSGENCLKFGRETVHINLARATSIYDGFAESLGLEREVDGNYYEILSA